MAEQVKPRPKGTAFVRNSKYRHVFGTPAQSHETIMGLKIGSVHTDAVVLKANPTWLAVPWNINGCIGVVSTSHKGAIHPEQPLIVHEETTVNDFNFNPFDDNMIASACNDGTVAIWKIPDGGLTESLQTPAQTITASEKRLLTVDFHPFANNVMMSIDAGKTIKLWDLNQGVERLTFPAVHKGLIANVSWNGDGSLVATACKDKNLRVFDPRANECVGETADLQGAKGSRVLWFHRKNLLFTCGFGKGSERQYALYDPRKLSERLVLQGIDNTSSTLFPHFDQDNEILFLAGKGDGNIRFYEVVDEDPYIHYLNEFKSKDPQTGITTLPKWTLDVMKCEIMRFLKLTPSGTVVPIRFEVPRQDNHFFQDDLFPDTFDGKPSMTSDEWFGGANTPPTLKSLDPSKE